MSTLFEVSAKRPLAQGIVELTLRSEQELDAIAPGAHVDLLLSAKLTRSYSIVDHTATDLKIAVLRQSPSRGGSDFVHDNLTVGSTVPLVFKRTAFQLLAAPEHHLIAGGVGITPLLSIAKALTQRGQNVVIHYAYRRVVCAAYLDQLRSGPWTLREYDASKQQRLDIGLLVASLPRFSQVFGCGPARMLDALSQSWLDCARSAELLQIERFAGGDIDRAGVAFDIEIASTGQCFSVPEDRSILQVITEQGLTVSFACEEGICGTCVTQVLDGEIDHRDGYLTDDERDAGLMAVCCSRAKGLAWS